LSQPQKPPLLPEEVELGLGLAVVPGEVVVELVVGVGVDVPVGVGELFAAFFAAFADGVVLPEALGVGVELADGLLLVSGVAPPADPDGQTVGNGRVGEALGLAAMAGAATNAPVTRRATALGTAMAVARRRE
jgi:hypothetical protein